MVTQCMYKKLHIYKNIYIFRHFYATKVGTRDLTTDEDLEVYNLYLFK